ncbi:retrotransposon protein, putative, unclassified [Cucumis melo var. makuwa]|uniref:Retrotransposon protein, putative, unclassified n=1 Tax=Cucumis melo var. makuwa TaxID=1194695 RepID=A0A5A7V3A7_CUCMM|nr:retrotransposon protein, putative, unclassified [Cucumis melo var. makuwa]
MVDSGATPNFITEKEAKRLNLRLEKDTRRMKAMNYVALPIVRLVKQTMIRLGGWKGLVDFVVVKMDHFDVVLGMEFLLEHQLGYYQVRTTEGDEPKTTCVTRNEVFEFVVMPFGLINAPATFLVYSSTMEEYRDYVHKLANYYSRFVEGFSKQESSLTELQKQAMIEGSVLGIANVTKPFKVETDASDYAFYDVFLQNGHPITYECQKLNAVEKWKEPPSLQLYKGMETNNRYLPSVSRKDLKEDEEVGR